MGCAVVDGGTNVTCKLFNEAAWRKFFSSKQPLLESFGFRGFWNTSGLRGASQPLQLQPEGLQVRFGKAESVPA